MDNKYFLKEHNKDEYENIKLFKEPVGYGLGPVEGEYFGIDVKKDIIKYVYPEAFSSFESNLLDGKLDFSFQEDKKRLNYEDNFIPLIFKYKGDNIGVELLTGIEIRFIDPVEKQEETQKSLPEKIIEIDNKETSTIDIKEFQEKLPKEMGHPLIITSNDYYVVDDEFKMVYAKFMRKYQDQIIKDLLKMNEESRELFSEKYDEIIDMCKDMAYTENILFDDKNKTMPIK
ncbi:MAG: hypothetical protein IJ105_03235 [Bacilli bacterium]|nr:hypothetical protein [Bacilli bacterium]